MSEGDSCGTGLFNSGRKPGDPYVDSIYLSAQSALGGISLSWSYPHVNAEGVAHTYVFRSAGSSDFNSSAQVSVAAGSTYFDRLAIENEGKQFFYWIKIVSVNGTVSDPIGPASTLLEPSADQIRHILTGKVGQVFLDSGLLTSIGDILLLKDGLLSEEEERLSSDSALGDLLVDLQKDLDEVDTVVFNRISELVTSNTAMVTQLNLLLAKSNDAAAAILTINQVRASDAEAYASSIETLQVATTTMNGKLEETKKVVSGLGATWSLKTDINGHVSGIALVNDGIEGSFLINAENFAIASTDSGGDIVTPFLISQFNGQPRIVLNAETLIEDGQIKNAMIGNIIQSNDYDGSNGTKGWAIDKSGAAIFNSGIFRGKLEAASGTFKGDITAGGGSTFTGDVFAKSLSTKDYIRISSEIPKNWEKVSSARATGVGTSITKSTDISICSTTVSIPKKGNRVVIDWSLAVYAYSAYESQFGFLDVTITRTGASGTATVFSGKNMPYSAFPNVEDNPDGAVIMEDAGTYVEAKDPKWYFHYNGPTRGVYPMEALEKILDTKIPPYNGIPLVQVSDVSNHGWHTINPETYKYTGSSVFQARSISFKIPIGNLFKGRGVLSDYNRELYGKQFDFVDNNPPIGSVTYELRVKSATTYYSKFGKNGSIQHGALEAIVQQLVL